MERAAVLCPGQPALARFMLQEYGAASQAGRGGIKRKKSWNKPQKKEKGEAAMSSSLRRATVIMILLGVILVPGLLQAKTPARGWARVDSRPASESVFFTMVWNLLTNLREIGTGMDPAGSSFAKNGGQMDPSGTPAPTPPSGGGNNLTGGDNGGQMDPSGNQ